MNWNLFWLFVGLNIVNVIVQTVKSIMTVKCGKWSAALINAFAYGFYTIVTIYMLCDLPLWWKAGIVALCNLIGVWIVKLIEEKARKDRLWKVEIAIPCDWCADDIKKQITLCGIPCNYIEVGAWNMFNCYCATQKQTLAVKGIAKKYGGKISAYESKTL